MGVRLGGADQTEARSDVIERGRTGGCGGDEGHVRPVVDHADRDCAYGKDQPDAHDVDEGGQPKIRIDRNATHSHRSHDLGPEDVFEFGPDDLDRHHAAHDLDASRRRAGRAADEHERDQRRLGGKRPQIEVRGAKAGSGQDRDDLEHAVADGCERAGLLGPVGDVHGTAGDHEAADHENRGHRENQAVRPQFGIAAEGAHVALKELEIQPEVHARQDHEADQDQLDGSRVKPADRAVECREPPGRKGGKRVADRVEPGHAGDVAQQQRLGNSQKHVDEPQQLSGRMNAWRDALGRGAGALDAKQPFAPHAQHGQHGHEQHDDAQPAEPLRHGPPEQQALRNLADGGEDGGPRRRESAHRFEVAVDPRAELLRLARREGVQGGPEAKGQGGECGAGQPAYGHQEQGLLAAEIPVGTPTEPGEHAAGQHADGDRDAEGQDHVGVGVGTAIGRPEPPRHWRTHAARHHDEEQTEMAANNGVIHGGYLRKVLRS